jgi:calmodulin
MATEIKQEHTKQLKELFSLCDRDGDGRLTPSEFEAILRIIGFQTENELKITVKKAAESSGYVDFSRYMIEMNRLLKGESDSETVKDAMLTFSSNDETVNVSEWKRIMLENTDLTSDDVSSESL